MGETGTLIFGLFCFIILVVFIVMSFNIGNIRKNLQSIQQMLHAWQQATGEGAIYKCTKCGKKFSGHPATCPHCGDPKDYTSELNKTK